MRAIVPPRFTLAGLVVVALLGVAHVDAAGAPATAPSDCAGFAGGQAPKGPDGGTTVFDDVATFGPDDVWIAGHDGTTFRTLAEHWNGTSWTVMSPPNPNPSNNAFNAVTTIPGGSGDLWAVGTSVGPAVRFGWPKA